MRFDNPFGVRQFESILVQPLVRQKIEKGGALQIS